MKINSNNQSELNITNSGEKKSRNKSFSKLNKQASKIKNHMYI